MHALSAASVSAHRGSADCVGNCISQRNGSFGRNSPRRTTLPALVPSLRKNGERERRKGSFGRESTEGGNKRDRVRGRGGREDVSGRISSRAGAIGEELRETISRLSRPLALLAYRYFGTRVRLRLTTARGTPAPPLHSFSLSSYLTKSPPMARTRNAKSARDVSIDSVTADLWRDSPWPIRKAPLHPLESVARRCGILHLRPLPLTRAGTDNVSPPRRRAPAGSARLRTHWDR